MAAKQTEKQKTTPASVRVLLRHAHISPRKMRLVANTIKNMRVNEAEAQLFIHERRPAGPLLKLLKSAIASAKSMNLEPEKLVIKEIRVDGGPMLKRWMPRAQGRATPIQKKTSHVTIILQETEKKVESNFVVEKKKKDNKKNKKESEKSKIKTSAEDEKKQETRADAKIESKTQEKGFTKKVFRRKSV